MGLSLQRGTNEKFVKGLGHSDGAPGEGIIDGRVFEVQIPLPETPAGGNRLSGIGLNGLGKGIGEALIGIRGLIDDDFGAGPKTLPWAGTSKEWRLTEKARSIASGEPEMLRVVAVNYRLSR